MFEAQSHKDAGGNWTDNEPYEPSSKGGKLRGKAW